MTVLISILPAWFVALFEKRTPILDNFDKFIKEYLASFGGRDNVRMFTNLKLTTNFSLYD